MTWANPKLGKNAGDRHYGLIEGTVGRGFERVRDAFARNWRELGELGAACAVYVGGERVVDLWGGVRDHRTNAPWEGDTMVLVFSSTKGMAALAMAVAHARGLFELDERVSTYWPEFARHGKDRITVRQLFTHQAGLSSLEKDLTPALIADHDALAEQIADERPMWEPGQHHGYHAMSLGFYQSELLRRTDGRSLGRFFADEIAGPHGIDFHIGLPSSVRPSRVARMKGFHPAEMIFHLDTLPVRFALAYLRPGSLARRSLDNPHLQRPDELDAPHYRPLELPSSNGIGSARGLALAYSKLAHGGADFGFSARTFDEIVAPPKLPSRGARDVVLTFDTAYALGFTRPIAGFTFGGPRSFGTPGAGGSFGFADPDRKLGYAYVTNRMGFYAHDDPREVRLRDAVYACL